MIRLSITDSSGEIQQALVVAANTLSDWQPFFRALGHAWRRSRERMYETAGASIGAPWPMYSRATSEHQYAAVKSRLFGRRMSRSDLLRWRDGQERLYPSMTDSSHPEHVSQATRRSGIYGTRVPYASNHDEGRGNMPDWAGGHPVPRRQLLAIGPYLEREISTLVGRFAAAGLHSIDESGRARAGLSSAQIEQLLRQQGAQ